MIPVVLRERIRLHEPTPVEQVRRLEALLTPGEELPARVVPPAPGKAQGYSAVQMQIAAVRVPGQALKERPALIGPRVSDSSCRRHAGSPFERAVQSGALVPNV